jgi:hypothetical protein
VLYVFGEESKHISMHGMGGGPEGHKWSAVIVFQGAKISTYMMKKRIMGGGLTNGSKGIYKS